MQFFFETKEGFKVTCVKKVFLVDLWESQYLFEMLQTSLTVKNSEHLVKSGCFEKRFWRRAPFSLNEGGI